MPISVSQADILNYLAALSEDDFYSAIGGQDGTLVATVGPIITAQNVANLTSQLTVLQAQVSTIQAALQALQGS